MEPVLVIADPPRAELLLALSEAGWAYRCEAGLDALEESDGLSAAVVVASGGVADALATCRLLRRRDEPVAPIVLVVTAGQLDELSLREDLFDDFVVEGGDAAELRQRIALGLDRIGKGVAAELIEQGPLTINLETYQAAVEGRVLDLTYMEYELLRFLAAHPTRVFTRETLLSRVWGYEYYGGARTVDVHIRRLRAKLGEEHAHLISTVRSVGYRFSA